MRHLVSVDDLATEEVREILDRAAELEAGALGDCGSFVVGLVFLTPSLRTRVGFTVAAARLGGTSVDVSERRFASGMTSPERFEDTLRTTSGMVDLMVCRTDVAVDLAMLDRHAVSPVICGGDTLGHPTQALVDLYAIESAMGPVGECRVAMCGDLTQRSARSLLQLFGRFPPRKLVLMAPEARAAIPSDVSPALTERAEQRPPEDLGGIDVVYLTGFPPGTKAVPLPDELRLRYALSGERLDDLDADALVLSPLPVIDEIADDARTDPRIGIWSQSDRSVFVRMALLELVRTWR